MKMNVKKTKKQRDKDLEKVSKKVVKIIKNNNLFEQSEISKCILRATYYLLEEQKYHEANTSGGEYTLSPFHLTFLSTIKTESNETVNEIVKTICYVSLDRKAGYQEWLKQEHTKVVKSKIGKRLQIYKKGSIGAIIASPLIRSIFTPVFKRRDAGDIALKSQKGFGEAPSSSAAIKAAAKNIFKKHELAVAVFSGAIKKSKKDDQMESKKKDSHKLKSWVKKLKESVKDSNTLPIKSSASKALESVVEEKELEDFGKNTQTNTDSEESSEEEIKGEETVKKKKWKLKISKIRWPSKFKKSK